jgi:hypothetical protein
MTRCALALLLCAVGTATASYNVKFEVSNLDGQPGDDHKGSFVMEVHDEWSPLGAARFKEMVTTEFFKGIRFFRVINGFMAQFGIHGKPSVAAEWKQKTLTDDPVVESNARGTSPISWGLACLFVLFRVCPGVKSARY